MFSVITNIYNKKTKGPTLMEFLTATGKMKKFFLTTRDVRCVHHVWHGTHRHDIQVLATHAYVCMYVCVLHGSQNSDYFPIQFNWLVLITETESVYCTVRANSLYLLQVTLSMSIPTMLHDLFIYMLLDQKDERA